MTEVSALLLPPSTGRPETNDPDLIAAVPGNSGAAQENSTSGRDEFAHTLEQMTETPDVSANPETAQSQDAPQDIAGEFLARLTETDQAAGDGRDIPAPPVPDDPVSDQDLARIDGDALAQTGDADKTAGRETPLPDQDVTVHSTRDVPPSDQAAKQDGFVNRMNTELATTGDGATAARQLSGDAARLMTGAGQSNRPEDFGRLSETGALGDPDLAAENGRDGPPRYFDQGWSGLQNSQQGQNTGDGKPTSPIPQSGGGFVAEAPSDTTEKDGLTIAPGLGIEAQAGRPAGISMAMPTSQALAGQLPPPPMQQIIVAIEKLTSGDRINLRLDPPDLGNVSIRLEITDGAVRAVVAAERPDTVELLARHRSELNQMLADAGFDDVETRIDLSGRDFGRNGREPGSAGDTPQNEVAVQIPGDRQGWQAGREWNESDLNDGRLDIRV